MKPMTRLACLLAAALLAGLAATAAAQDSNITQPIADLERLLAAEPLVITQAEISRPKAKGDITLRADVSFGGAPPLRVKLRKAEPGADTFNNVPRYDLAAYELQKLFIDPAEYVVPPTALRFIPRADFAKYQPDVTRTFSSADQVLAVLQYWLSDITVVADVYDPARFDADPVYARHIGQLNVLTYLIEHRDSNVGNFLIGKSPTGARVFSIDHGVAFASIDSDRGEAWKDIRVNRLPADTVLFHLTRLNHMSTSCVGCGMCTGACPSEIPVGQIFRAVAHKTQAIFDYEPGRSVDDPLPVTTFREDELADTAVA